MNTDKKCLLKVHILTLFPDMVMNGLNTSIIGRAAEEGIVEIHAVNIRDFTKNKHGKVDDYTYGGGAGMLMQAQPVYDAYKSIVDQNGEQGKPRRRRTLYVTPQGEPFTQKKARELAGEEELILLCGHYEGIDERVLEEVVTDYISIGDYVLTGGELAAMVITDAVARLVPGVLGNAFSSVGESFHNDLLEYPQYSRPEVWHDKAVPQVLLSGNHRLVEEWRLKQAKERTAKCRPDLYARYEEKQALIKKLSKKRRKYIHMIELLRRGEGEIVYEDGEDLLLANEAIGLCQIQARSRESGERLISLIPKGCRMFVSSSECVNELLEQAFGVRLLSACRHAVYTGRELLPVRYRDIRKLMPEHLPFVAARYHNGGEEYLEERIRSGNLYGLFVEDKPAGFVGIHDDGSTGMLFVEEEHRGRGFAKALLAYCMNRQKERGWTPYSGIFEGNQASLRLHEEMGLYLSQEQVWWYI